MPRFRPTLWPTIFTIPTLILMLALGWWQLERREWKHDLMATLEARLSAAPVTLDEIAESPEEAAFRRISVSGRFLHEHEMHFPGRTMQGRVGFEIMTPLALEDGRYLVVDRGWVPQDTVDAARRPESLPEGPVTVTGAVRFPPEPGLFTPDNAPEQNEWFSVDPVAAARAAGIEPGRMLPFYVVAAPEGPDGGLPIPRGTRLELPDNHLQYAITWFSLGAVLVAIYVLYHLRRPGER